jgi:hypothetical protein
VVKSLENIAKEEELKNRQYVPQDVIFDIRDHDSNYVKLSAMPTPLLKLKIRNTTQYLKWRIAVLKRDNFTCRICHVSVKENKSLRLEVHHPKSLDDICKENNVTTIEQAIACEELWNVNNGVSICYICHKYVESLRTKLRNMFILRNVGKI